MDFARLHPLIVHFPIALLTLYAFLELIPIKDWRDKLFTTKAVLIFFGTISILAARFSGDLASKSHNEIEHLQLLKTHELWSLFSLVIFIVISILYSLITIKKTKVPYLFLAILALIGLIAISFTGALGGAIVWGEKNDPFVEFVYNLLIQK